MLNDSSSGAAPFATGARTADNLSSFGRSQLGSLCRAVGLSTDERAIMGVFETLAEPWSHRIERGSEPAWRSDISDDHTPYEFSVAYEGGRNELRMLVEPQPGSAVPMSLAAGWQAGRAVIERLRLRYGACSRRFEQIMDLFEPEWEGARFSLWLAACCRHGEPPDFKIYLNPQCKGPDRAALLVEQALGRLGFDHAWTLLRSMLDQHEKSRLSYFSLDLSSGSAARVKVYLAHPDSSAAEVDSIMRLAGGVYEPGMARQLSRLWVGHEGPFDRRPLISCYAFTSGNDTGPLSATFHFPIRNYVADDSTGLQAVERLLDPATGAVHRSAVESIATRPLDAGAGLQSYISVRKQAGQLRTTVYLSAEAYWRTPSMTTSDENTFMKALSEPAESKLGDVFAHIARNADRFADAALFRHMRDTGVPAEKRLSYIPYMTHFVMTFADLYAVVLREEPANDRFQELVNIHSYEDGGHWKWYLADLARMGYDPMLRFTEAIRFIWGDASKQQRILSYQICRLGFGASSLRKLILAQCIEATGKVGLEMTALVEKDMQKQADPYKSIYFGSHHFETESEHTLEDEKVLEEVYGVALSGAEAASLKALADEAFGYFTAFTDEALRFAQAERPAAGAHPLFMPQTAENAVPG